MVLSKAVLASCATAAAALTLTACGGSTSSTMSSASSAMSSTVSSAMASAAGDAMAEGTLASVCTEIDGVMLGQPDADPAGTAEQLEAIKAKVTTADADLLENLAAAYTAIAANPADTEAQSKLQSSAKALGAGCEMATTAPKPN